MNVITNKISIDLMTEPDQSPVVYAVQGECNARRVEVELLCDGNPWQIPENVILMVRYGRVDMTGGYYDTLPDGTPACNASGNTIFAVLTSEMMAVSGIVHIQIEMQKEDMVLSTFSFRLAVASNPAVGALEVKDYINIQKWLERELEAYIEEVNASGQLLGGTMTGPIDMNGQALKGLKTPVHSSEASTKGYTDLAVKRAVVRNLLDNSDFRNPVNQRGQTSYTATGYTIDRWRTYSEDETVEIQNGYISKTGNLLQYVSGLDPDKTYTAVVCLADGTIATGNGILSSGLGSWSDKFYAAYDTSTGLLSFRLTSNTVDVAWAALYEGEFAAETLPEYQPKGYGAELAECLRYFYRNWNGPMSPFTMASLYCPINARTTSVMFPVPMRVTPTVTLYNPATGHSGCVADWSTDEDVSAVVAYSNEHHFILDGSMTAGQMLAYHYEASADL